MLDLSQTVFVWFIGKVDELEPSQAKGDPAGPCYHWQDRFAPIDGIPHFIFYILRLDGFRRQNDKEDTAFLQRPLDFIIPACACRDVKLVEPNVKPRCFEI